MHSTKIVRRIDDLGRIVIPKDIRSTLKIRGSDPFEVYVDAEGNICLKRYRVKDIVGDLQDLLTDVHRMMYEIPVTHPEREELVETEREINNLAGKLRKMQKIYLDRD